MSKTAAEWAEECYDRSGVPSKIETVIAAAMAQARDEGEERGRREMQRDAIRVAIEQPPEYWVAGEVIAAAIRNLPDKASR